MDNFGRDIVRAFWLFGAIGVILGTLVTVTIAWAMR